MSKQGTTEPGSERRGHLLIALAGTLLLLGIVASSGCSLEDGAQEGIEAGTEAAIAALIQAPVNEFIDQAFGDK